MNSIRSLFFRLRNLFHKQQLDRDLHAELAAHLELHIEDNLRSGMSPAEARRHAHLKLGGLEQTKESVRDASFIPWLGSLRRDASFGWRQISKNKVTSVAAVLSLALAIGSCSSAFRLIDALLLRPLPVAHPEGLFVLTLRGMNFEGIPGTFEPFQYPLFQQMRAVVKDQADLMAISYVESLDVTYSPDQETEKAHVQYVSGSMFNSFGLRPALGRLLGENEDLTHHSYPYAVLSHDYWSRRFGDDPKVIGRAFRFDNDLYEIVGVTEKNFTGTEPGTVTDIFVPAVMHPDVDRSDVSWLRMWVRLKPGVANELVRQKLQLTFRTFQTEKFKGLAGVPQASIDNLISQTLVLYPAAAGVSDMQKDNRLPLTVVAVLVILVLLIACANVANLMAAQASARAREMALRLSIGATRWQLVQLVLMEGAWIALLASVTGGLFGGWAAPFVVSRINPPGNPVRLALPTDWRFLAFSLALTLAVICLFSLFPTLRASAVRPSSALKGGEDSHSRRRLMQALIAAQVAFCFLVLYVAGLFVATLERLRHQPTGFSAERLLAVDVATHRPELPVMWNQIVGQLQTQPGVEKVALASWPLLIGYSENSFVTINGAPSNGVLSYFLNVSPGWVDVMRIPLIDGRDFLYSDTSSQVAIVNEAFARAYFHGENPIGRFFTKSYGNSRHRIVGLVRDASYRSVREPFLPIAYVPFQSIDENGALQPQNRGTYLVRTSAPDPRALASSLRQGISQASSEFRVSSIRTQLEINQAQTVRERLLVMLATFFSIVALVLAAVGLYGVLHYSVLQRRREIGIRMAVGAQAANIARLVTIPIFSMILVGSVTGLALGMLSVRYIEALFYQVKATDAPMLTFPALAILAAASLAALPGVIQAIRTDPATILRFE